MAIAAGMATWQVRKARIERSEQAKSAQAEQAKELETRRMNLNITRATFWLTLRRMFADHQEVHAALRPNGEWSKEQKGVNMMLKRFALAGSLAVMLLGTRVAIASDPATDPKGSLDTATTAYISGWACDPSDYSQPLPIHLYATNTPGTGFCFPLNGDNICLVDAYTANVARPDIGGACNGQTVHGFSIPTPATLLDGNQHKIYVFALNIGVGSNFLLTGSSTAMVQTSKVRPVAVTSSNTYAGSSPANAIDADPGTVWNAGGGPDQWIQLDFGRSVAVRKIRLQVHQVPNGTTTHQIWVGQDPSALRLIRTFSGSTQDAQWLEHAGDGWFADKLGNVRYVRITTTASPSWVAWREIEVFQGVEFLGYFRSGADNHGTGDYTVESADSGANLTWIMTTDMNTLAGKLTVAKNRQVKAIIDLNTLLFLSSDKPPVCYTRNGNWLSSWNAVKTLLNTPGSGYSDTVAAFYLADEPYIQGYLRGTPIATMKTWLDEISAKIHQDFPSKPIAVQLAVEELEPTGSCGGGNGCGLGLGSSHLAMFDWVGVNCYGPWTSCGTYHHPMDFYLSTLRGWLSNTQRMIAVLDAHYEDGNYSHSLADQAVLVDRANRWHAEVLSDGKYVAIVPFIWQDIHSLSLVGTSGMAWLKERLYQFATTILNTGTTNQVFSVAYWAPNSWNESLPFAATNRNDFDAWNAGGYGPKYIQFDLGGSTKVTRVELLTHQVPEGWTTHYIYSSMSADPWPLGWVLVGTFQGNTHDHQLLTWTGSLNTRYILVMTDSSPSWVAWKEVRFFREEKVFRR